VIKYIGSKRRLVPVLAEIARAVQADRALDLFTGTTRVAQAFRAGGATVTAVDITSYAHTFAKAYVATDLGPRRAAALGRAVAELDALPGRSGYVTDVFCTQARYLTPENGARVDAIRAAIAERHAGTWLEPVLLTALVEAADRVDSTTGLQMAYLKSWAPRALRRLTLVAPDIPRGPKGRAIQGDATALVGRLGTFDLAYLDPPYNQHRYESNYHVWDTIVRDDRPDTFGVARKRVDLRDRSLRSPFNDRTRSRDALAACVRDVDARVVVVSQSSEGWVTHDELVELCSTRGRPERIAVPTRRYVGAQIGIHSPSGEKVGTVSHLHNVEFVVVTGALTRSERLILRRIAARCAAPPS
jgi:adenine-specific DNA-methyltransferase